jgi:hypothetical protein
MAGFSFESMEHKYGQTRVNKKSHFIFKIAVVTQN